MTIRINSTRVASYMGIQPSENEAGKDYSIASSYGYVESKFGEMVEADEEGKVHILFPAVTVNPKVGYKIRVVVNAELAQVGPIGFQSILEPGEGERLAVVVTPLRECDYSELDWLVRLYLEDTVS